MVKRGLVDSRESAQRLILAHKVRLGEKYAEKPGQLVPLEAKVEILEELKYVSRGGYKLEAALDQFQIDVSGKTVLDVGASTGGFTHCVLLRGARKVYAVDVGYGQMAWKLREDPRVVVLERVNARSLTPEQFPERIDLAVMDVSFIGAEKILSPVSKITGEVVLLFKPQFEAGPKDVPRGGVIRDSRIHEKVLEAFFSGLKEWLVGGLIESPIAGASGNKEFLIHLKKEGESWSLEQLRAKIQQLNQ